MWCGVEESETEESYYEVWSKESGAGKWFRVWS